MLDLTRFPRVPLCHSPTPLERMDRLTAKMGGPNLWVKRDDCTGLAGGGNKTRKLEFLIGEAVAQGADIVVTQGAVQSNHVRQTAAAARKHGMACHALLERRVPDPRPEYESNGNVLLDQLFGATIEYRDPGVDMNAEAVREGERLAGLGQRPYVIPGGGSNDVGALGYAVCADELVSQSAQKGLKIDWVVTATGSTGTHAGLLAGLHALKADMPVMGVCVRQPADRQIEAVHKLAVLTCTKLGVSELPRELVRADDGYIGAGYGIPADSTFEAIAMAALEEGLLLDPVYSAKGFAGLLGLIRAGFFGKDDNVVFLHTGGAQVLAAYETGLREHIVDAA